MMLVLASNIVAVLPITELVIESKGVTIVLGCTVNICVNSFVIKTITTIEYDVIFVCKFVGEIRSFFHSSSIIDRNKERRSVRKVEKKENVPCALK